MIKKMTELEQITQDFKARKRALDKKVDAEILNLVKKSLEHNLCADDIKELVNNKEAHSIYSIEPVLCVDNSIRFRLHFQNSRSFPICIGFSAVSLGLIRTEAIKNS